MKEKKLFECEHCHTSYADKEKAKACEKNHKMVRGIIDTRYNPIEHDQQGYPNAIYVEFCDGMKGWYRR